MPIKRISEEEAKLGRQYHLFVTFKEMKWNKMIHFLECDKQKVLPSKCCLHLTDTLYGLLRGGKTREGNTQIIFVTAGFTIFIGPKVVICPVTACSRHCSCTSDLITHWGNWLVRISNKDLGRIPDDVCFIVEKQLSDRWNLKQLSCYAGSLTHINRLGPDHTRLVLLANPRKWRPALFC